MANKSSTIFTEEDETLWYVVASTMLMVIVTIFTIAGNVFVITAIFTNKSLRIVPTFLFVSLATADLTVALLVMPFHISVNVAVEWNYGEVWCKMWLTLDVLLCTASILNLCIIALDRYWAIQDPLNYVHKRTLKRILFMIATAWILSGIISIPPVFGWGDSGSNKLYDEELKSCTFSSDKGYVLYSALGAFYIPLLVMSFVYLNIYLATKRHLKNRTKAARIAKVAMCSSTNSNLKPLSKNENVNEISLPEKSDDTSDSEEVDTCISDDILQRDTIEASKQQMSNSSITCNTTEQGLKRGCSDKNTTPTGKTASKEHSNKSHSSRHRCATHTFFKEKERISLSKERRATKRLFVIMVTFVVCWIPFFLFYIIVSFCETCPYPGLGVEVFFVWLGYVNSMLNPIIYTYFHRDLRKIFKNTIAGWFCKCKVRTLLSRP